MCARKRQITTITRRLTLPCERRFFFATARERMIELRAWKYIAFMCMEKKSRRRRYKRAEKRAVERFQGLGTASCVFIHIFAFAIFYCCCFFFRIRIACLCRQLNPNRESKDSSMDASRACYFYPATSMINKLFNYFQCFGFSSKVIPSRRLLNNK